MSRQADVDAKNVYVNCENPVKQYSLTITSRRYEPDLNMTLILLVAS